MTKRYHRRVLYLAVFCFGALLLISHYAGRQGSSAAKPELTVAAAASLREVLPKLTDPFTARTGIRINPYFAASGSIARQIRSGAPIDLFLSADRDTPEHLAGGGHVRPGTLAVFAVGTLALAIGGGSPTANLTLAELTGPRIKKLAIANPDLAPYGAAARAACRHAGVWDRIQDKLVICESVDQARTYFQQGEVEAAFLPGPVVFANGWRSVPIPPGAYPPLEHTLAIPVHASHPDAAEQFAAFLLGPDGQRILRQIGYLPPSSPPAR